MKKVHCPLHEDKTPSLALYEKTAYCFGGCGEIPYSKLPLGMRTEQYRLNDTPEREAANLEELGRYVDSLPTQAHRGFLFETDFDGYYLRFPDSRYILKRQFRKEPKYLGPSGHKRPLFYIAKPASLETLMIVEGEFNALAVARMLGRDCPRLGVVSPGSAGEFSKPELMRLIDEAKWVVAVADADSAGISALIKLKAQLRLNNKPIQTYAVEKDASDVYTSSEDGPAKVYAQYKAMLFQGM